MKKLRKVIYVILILLISSSFVGVNNVAAWGNTEAKVKINGEKIKIPKWSIDEYSNYYVSVGKSSIKPKKFPKNGEIEYGGFDDLGRTTEVKGSLIYQNVENSRGNRLPFATDGSSDPSGWKKNEEKAEIISSNGSKYNGFFWNRSHLIANSLGGNAKRENVITGTRTQNVGEIDGGMRYTEKKAQQWLETHKEGGVLYYQATPYYHKKELIPRYVIVSMKSSDGEIDEVVVVYNTANGYEINYSDGTFKKK